MQLFERKVSQKILFKGNAINFRVDEVLLPNDKRNLREFIEHPGAVAVLPILNDNKIVLVKQYRYPIKKVTFEIPAGKLCGKRDKPLQRIRRELKEETGYTAKKIIHLVDFWPTPAFSNEMLKIYLATGLKKGKSKPDEDEFLKIKKISLSHACKMIKKGQIKDAKTIIAIQMYIDKAKISSHLP